MSATDLEANDLLEARFRNGTGSYDVGFSTTLPADDGTGWTEPTDPDYTRESIARDTATWNAAAARFIDTAVDLPWATAASGDWTDLIVVLLFDPGTDDLRYYLRLSTRLTVAAGTNARLAAGELWFRVPTSTLTP